MGVEIPPSLLPYLLGEKTDYSSLQQSLLTVNIIFIVAIVFTTGLRVIVRYQIRAGGLDDVFIILALIFALLLSISCFIGYGYGLGKHIWNLDSNLLNLPHAVGRITKALYGCQLAYSTSITFTKLSIMATYTRVFRSSFLKYTVFGAGVVVVSFWIISIFTIVFTCVPVQAAWDYTITDARCINIVHYFYVFTIVNIGTDILLCFLPIPTIWNLVMPKAQKVVVCLLLTMGTFACVASVLRLAQLHRLTGVDIPYQIISFLNWSVIEVGTAIVCISLSALRPLLPSFFAYFTTPTNEIRGVKLGEGVSNEIRGAKLGEGVSNGTSDASVSGNIYVQQSFEVELVDLPTWPGDLERIERRKYGTESWAGHRIKSSSEEELNRQA